MERMRPAHIDTNSRKRTPASFECLDSAVPEITETVDKLPLSLKKRKVSFLSICFIPGKKKKIRVRKHVNEAAELSTHRLRAG